MSKIREQLNEKLAQYKIIEARLAEERAAWIAADDRASCAEQARVIIQEIAQVVQQSIHHKISSVVSRCLETVFDDPYEFEIKFEQKRGRTEASLQFVRGDLRIDDPTEEIGGGVIDVAAFALRLACLVLIRPPVRRLLVLDEPFRFVSKEYRPKVRALIEALSEEMDVQCIMVTHIPELRCGKIVEIT